jgi:hypothetical protein
MFAKQAARKLDFGLLQIANAGPQFNYFTKCCTPNWVVACVPHSSAIACSNIVDGCSRAHGGYVQCQCGMRHLSQSDALFVCLQSDICGCATRHSKRPESRTTEQWGSGATGLRLLVAMWAKCGELRCAVCPSQGPELKIGFVMLDSTSNGRVRHCRASLA